MRILPAFAAASVPMLGAPVITHAQDAADTQRTTTMNDDSDGGDLGWLGLLGLAGLLGLRRRDSEDTVVAWDNNFLPRM